MSFDNFAFDRRIVAGIVSKNYSTPTPIQKQAIPPMLEGRDVMGLAQTGTGKTAAFALPLLQHLAEGDRRGIRVLVLAPTRELALQIHEEFTAFGKRLGIRSAVAIGGVGQNPQVRALRGAQVCVACPGRLLDLMNQRVVDLSKVKALVLDEADRMLDMGFMPDVRRITAALPKERQNCCFSATMPREISDLTRDLLRDPVRVQVDNTAPAASIRHAMYPVPHHLKFGFLETLLKEEEHDHVLVFTRTKHRAKGLARKLDKIGFAATSLQGNMTQNQRQRALDGFKKGAFRIMVATDIAARGIDCSNISHVINFDVPDTAETYTHRIGRTGRAGRDGRALTLITGEDRDMVRAIERVLGERVRREELAGFDYGQPRTQQQAREHQADVARGDEGRARKDQARNAGSRGRGRRPVQARNAEAGTDGNRASGNRPMGNRQGEARAEAAAEAQPRRRRRSRRPSGAGNGGNRPPSRRRSSGDRTFLPAPA